MGFSCRYYTRIVSFRPDKAASGQPEKVIICELPNFRGADITSYLMPFVGDLSACALLTLTLVHIANTPKVPVL